MWQDDRSRLNKTSNMEMWAGTRQGGAFTDDVVDLTSPMRAAAPQFVSDDRQHEEDEFPCALSQDSVISFAIRRTPGDTDAMESPTAPVDEENSEKLVIEAASKISRDSLNEEQREAANMAIYGRGNIFLTGAAGTGKSFLLRYIIQELKARRKGNVFVTATTGVAAENIKGTTLHSFAGIGLGEGSADTLLTRIKSKKAPSERWSKVRFLIVDEVSMLHVDLFEKLEEIARRFKNISKNKKKPSKVENEKPFGGIKLILCGDFFQLPPVDRKRHGNKYAFQSDIWNNFCAIRTVSLKEVHRQTDDIFVNLLNEIRIGKFSDHTRIQLDACHINVKPLPKDGILPTRLYCLNRNVDAENMYHLNQLPQPDFVYTGNDKWIPRRAQRDYDDYDLEEQYSAYAEEDDDFSPNGKIAIIAELDRKCPVSIRLRVGAQVMYTRNDPALGLVNGSRGVVVKLEDSAPTVKFDNGSVLALKFANQGQSCAEGKLIRHYMPLKLAWALTVHKSQGMTLTRVELQLDNAFECGQVYVALSRVKSLPGLFIRGGRITPDLVRADESVLAAFGPTETHNSNQATIKTYFSATSAVEKRKRPEEEQSGHGRVSIGLNSSSGSDGGDSTDESSGASDAHMENKNVSKRHRDRLHDNQYRAGAQSKSGGRSSHSHGESHLQVSHRRGQTDVIDLVSPIKCKRPTLQAQPNLDQDVRTHTFAMDAFNRVVNSNGDFYQLHDDVSLPHHNQWASDATQPLPAPSSQVSQHGPFSATFSQIRNYAYETATSRPASSSSSSSSSAASSSSAGEADAYWRARSLPTRTHNADHNDQAVDIHQRNATTFQAHMDDSDTSLRAPPSRASNHLDRSARNGVAAAIDSRLNLANPFSAPSPTIAAPAPVPAPVPLAATALNKVILYFDGGSLGNPGKSGAGYLIYPYSPQPPHVAPTSVPLAQAAVRMNGVCTNNQAEYTGLIHGLQAAVARNVRQVDVYGDSELVIKQMKGEYKVKNVVLQGMNQKAQVLARRFSRINFHWVERSKNKPADALSNRAMHQSASAEECADFVGIHTGK